MSYTDVNIPVIDRITLPSGNTYYVADREIRDVVQALSEAVAAGVTFIIAWDGKSIPIQSKMPIGMVIEYNGITYTGELTANNAQPGAFYLVKSTTLPSNEGSDIFEEYIPVGEDGNKTWEKIGDTQINLTDIITEVELIKQTDNVIGADATFAITQPTIELTTYETTDTGRTEVGTGTGTASTTNTDWLKGVSVSNGILSIGAATQDTTYLGATASGANTEWDSKDTVSILTSDTDINITKGSV